MRTPVSKLDQTQLEARQFTDQVDRDRQKKTGEVFTPQYLVDEMINRVPGILNPGTTVLEPAAGDGNIVARLIERKIQEGKCSPEQAISDVHACEYMVDNRNAIVKRIEHVVTEAGFEWTDRLAKMTEMNVAYCNTVDPWDTTEGRKFPGWLVLAIPAKDWLDLRCKSKFAKGSNLFADKTIQAEREIAGSSGVPQFMLDL